MSDHDNRGRVWSLEGDRARVLHPDGHIGEWSAGDTRVGDLVDVHGGNLVVVHRPGHVREDAEWRRLGPERIAGLRVRAAVLRAIREFFDAREFIEIEPSIRVPQPGLELHIDAIPSGDGFLITSPEFQMKRLLAAGLDRIYAICRCSRGEEAGPHHSVEFSMLEWYRGFDTLDTVMSDTEALIRHVAEGTGRTIDGIDLAAPWVRRTVHDLVDQCAGVDISGATGCELRDRAMVAGIDVGTATAWDDVFYTVFLERVEPWITAQTVPVFITDWPIELAALARVNDNDPTTVERFELYISGVELANAFGELTSSTEQRERFEVERSERRERGKPAYGTDEKFISALADGIPPSAGIALGVDRLAMLIAGADAIAMVQPFATGEL